MLHENSTLVLGAVRTLLKYRPCFPETRRKLNIMQYLENIYLNAALLYNIWSNFNDSPIHLCWVCGRNWRNFGLHLYTFVFTSKLEQ